jgi:hypothetical protein
MAENGKSMGNVGDATSTHENCLFKQSMKEGKHIPNIRYSTGTADDETVEESPTGRCSRA